MNRNRFTVWSLSVLLSAMIVMSGCETLFKKVVVAMATAVYGEQSEKQLKNSLIAQYQKLKMKCPYGLTVDVTDEPPIYDGVNFSFSGKTYGSHVRVKFKMIRMITEDPSFWQPQSCVLDAVFEPANQSGQLFRVIVKHRDGDKKLGCGPIMFSAEQIFQGFFRNWLDQLEANMRKTAPNIEATGTFFTEDNMLFIARRK